MKWDVTEESINSLKKDLIKETKDRLDEVINTKIKDVGEILMVNYKTTTVTNDFALYKKKIILNSITQEIE